eukprot:TRINITY_DN72_c0_g1_i5.p1 TRINITY_DN72_c0_g1~~TRINITY_DN72_c0_g1_i5.p1  ORF type:complete len:623 (+),score=111.04 TRINITY_DN72_c0_g1_i5:110-1978(+)
MKTAGLMMTTLMASAMGAVTNVVVNDVVTCNADTDCRQHGDTTATCATTGKCTCTAGGNHAVYGTGNNALNLCRPNTNPPANPKVTLYYLLRNIDATNKAVNCDNAGTFTAPYDTLIKGQATTTKGFETVEIVHLCHKSTAGVHTLRTSIKTQVSITNLVSATATTSDPFKTLISDINTALGASTNTALASVGTIDSAETIASTGLGRFCDTTLTHVTAPFVAAPTTTKANNQCKAVSCAKGYSFDKAAATPTCSGPGAFASSNILTCGTATDCAKYGQTGACDATTKKCTAAGTTCVHFSVGTNTLAQCNEAAAPAATDKITLYYILRHGTMTGDSTKAVDCTKESEFTTPYDALIKTAAGFSATELTTVSIVHHCTGTSTLATSIKFEVTVSDLLTNTNSKYSEIANNINDALIQSTDAKLKAVGAVSTVKVGSSEAYTGLCPASGTGEAMQVPMGTNELSTVAGTRDCQAVECSTGYFLSDAEVCTVNTPSPVATATPGTTTGTFAIAVSEFTTPYNTLIQTAVGFSTAELRCNWGIEHHRYRAHRHYQHRGVRTGIHHRHHRLQPSLPDFVGNRHLLDLRGGGLCHYCQIRVSASGPEIHHALHGINFADHGFGQDLP